MKNFIRICAMISVFLAGISACVLVVSAQFTFFVYDDFALGKVGELSQGVIQNLTSSIKYAFEAWFTWSGDVSTLFLQSLLSPIRNGGLGRLHIVLAVEMIFLFLSMGFFLYRCFRNHTETAWLWIMIGTIFCVFLNGRSYSQVFHYFIASMYGVSLGFLCLALSFFMLCHKSHKVVYFVLTIIFAMMAMTGTLLEAGAGCMFVLSLLLYYHKENELFRSDVILFFVFLGGAVFSAFAPGNFARHGVTENNLSIFKALLLSFRAYVIQLEWMIKDTAFVLLFLVALLCGLLHGWKRKTMRMNLLLLLFAVMVPLASIFPTVYGSGSPYLPERVLLNIDFFIIVGWTFFVVSCGNALANLFKENIKEATAAIVVSFCVIICIMPNRIENAATYIVARSMGNGELKRYYREVNEVLKEIETSNEEDVVIYSLPNPAEGIISFDISEDPDYFANEVVASYYGKRSVRLGKAQSLTEKKN